MAIYQIRTTRQQEIGLKFSYDHYADKTQFPTQAEYFQFQINHSVTDPMFAQQQAAQVKSFDESFKTIPETEQPAAQVEIEAVITSHGGEIVPPGSVVTPAPSVPPFSNPDWLPPGMLPPPTQTGMIPWPPPQTSTPGQQTPPPTEPTDAEPTDGT
jgi:hypothetical protein